LSALIAFPALLVTAGAAGASPSITVSPSTDLSDGQTVDVSGIGWTPGDQLTLFQCKNVDIGGGNSPCGNFVTGPTVDGDGAFQIGYVVEQSFDAVNDADNTLWDCGVAEPCEIVVADFAVGQFADVLISFEVDVTYTFTGFAPPVENDQSNSAKAGQPIPLKWRLTDSSGAPVDDPASFLSVTSSSVSCSELGPADAIETYAGGSGLQYLGDGNWQFNWKTPKSYAGICRQVSVNLADGSSYTAEFIFK
jgi:hypothetical protein